MNKLYLYIVNIINSIQIMNDIDDIKSFGYYNRRMKLLKRKSTAKKAKCNDSRSRYRIVINADMNKMNNYYDYSLPNIYIKTVHYYYGYKAYRPKVFK